MKWKHGQYLTKTYRSWDHAIQRCTNPKNHRYYAYGGRGIKMHQPWIDSFEAFYAYMGPRPEGCTIDRIDVNGHYEPGNVRWATRAEQYANQRKTSRITWRGRTLSVAEWAAELGMTKEALRTRLFKRGWGIERAMTAPVKYKRAARAEVPSTSQLLGL